MPCSAYTCLDVCKKSFTYLQQFSRYLGKCRVAPFFWTTLQIMKNLLSNNQFSELAERLFSVLWMAQCKLRQSFLHNRLVALCHSFAVYYAILLLFQVILVFVAILLLSRRLSDRVLLLIGLFLESATIAFLLWFIPQATDGTSRQLTLNCAML